MTMPAQELPDDIPDQVLGSSADDVEAGDTTLSGRDVTDPVERSRVLARVLAGDVTDVDACHLLGLRPTELARWKLHTLEALEQADPRQVVTIATTNGHGSNGPVGFHTYPAVPTVPTPSTTTASVPPGTPGTDNRGPATLPADATRLIAAAAVGVLAFAVSLVLVLPEDVALLDVLNPIARLAMYLGALVAAGGILYLWRVHDGAADEPEAEALQRAVRIAAIVGVVGTVLGLGMHGAAIVGDGALGALDPRNLVEGARGTVGSSLVLRLLGLGYVLFAIRRLDQSTTRAVGLVGAGLVLMSFLLVGHTMTAEPRALMMVTNLVHTVAAAGWFGGLALLSITLRHRRGDDDLWGAAGIVKRFSSFALVSVVVLVASGTVLATITLPTMESLFTSTYGSMVIAKIALAGLVLTVAGRNHRTLVPAVVDGDDRRAWSQLRRTIGIELGGLVLILLATALLVNLSPPA